MKKTLFILLVLINHTASSQDKELFKKWHMIGTTNCSGERYNPWDETYWDINLEKNIATVSFRGGLTTKEPYTIKGDSLILPYAGYEILKFTKDSLELSYTADLRCLKHLFVSLEFRDKHEAKRLKELEQKQKQHYFVHEGDTIYHANKANSPKLIGLTNQRAYVNFFHKYFPELKKSSKECSITMHIIIDKDGNVVAPKGKITCNSKIVTMEKIAEQLKGLWEPMILEGKPVSAMVRFKFIQKPMTHTYNRSFGSDLRTRSGRSLTPSSAKFYQRNADGSKTYIDKEGRKIYIKRR